MTEPTILYEDDHLLAVNKPSGLVVHRGVGVDESETLAGWILQHYPDIADVGEGPEGAPRRPGMPHRLDKGTSGVMIIAKRQEVFTTLKRHFQKGQVQKEYHAFVHGAPKQDRGTVTLPLGRSVRDFRKRSARSIRGQKRDACTEYVVETRCKDASLVRFYPKTGRTHQIRVHAQALQSPIVGDTLYAPRRPVLFGFSRLALHAYRLTLTTHLTDNEPLDLIAPYPDDFLAAKEQCSRT
ncbi:MAG: RluA family pseudouridine synthase [Candidatus Kaiserbacteria bacterium]|nr:RluA family pseudouridine synthase [Candidatus Kaiserbacteria bacterium]